MRRLGDARRAALRTALGYAVLAGLWILVSDNVAAALVSDHETLRRVAVAKGWAFVGLTAVLLYLRIETQIRRWSDEVDRRQASEEQLRRITRAVEQGPASVVVTDLSGRIQYVNEKFTRVTGYSRAEAIGQNTRVLKSGNTPPEVYRQLWDAITSGNEWRGDLHNRRKDGTLFWESALISPVHDDAGRITSFLAVKEDITDRRHLEEQLRQSQKLEAVGTLAGGVAHDFNNLLTIILGSASMQVDSETTPDEHRQLAQQVVYAANRASGLTRQLLLFSRKHAMQRSNLNASELMLNLTKLLGRVLGLDVTIVTRFASGLPPVFADAGMLEQVMLNLAVNARHAMPTGGRLTLSTDVIDFKDADTAPASATASRPYVRITVSDTGTGIPDDVLPHIFEPFFTTKGAGKGTGLGLSTAYGIVQQHDGWIDVDSTPGAGTTFAVFLPVSTHTTAAVADSSSDDRSVLRGRETVLVVDDEPVIRSLASEILRRYGYRVIEAESGDLADRIATSHDGPIDLLFTDLLMPGHLDGAELARRLQKSRDGLRVLYTSGHRDHADRDDVNVDLARHFVPKPYDSATLARAVRQRLDGPA